jgi:hypothetical protein
MRIFVRLFACMTVFVLSGCGGGGGKDVNGSLTVAAGSPTTSANSAQVKFTVTYTNPQKTNVLDTPISVVVTFGGQTIDSFNYYTSNSGVNTFTYAVDRQTSDELLVLTAKTGDLVAGDGATVTGLGTLAANPGSITLTAVNTPVTSTISGGLAPYSYSKTDPNLTVSISGTTLSVQTSTLNGGNTHTTVIITDSLSPTPNALVVPVTY